MRRIPAFLSILALTLAAPAAANVAVVESTPSRLVLSWEMSGFQAVTHHDGRGPVTHVMYEGGYVATGDSGAALIPGYAVHAGVPAQGAVRITVVPEEMAVVSLAHPIERRPDAGLGEPPVFASRWVSEPSYGMLRDYRAARFVLRPVQDMGHRRVRLLKRARIVIDLPAAAHTGASWVPRDDYERMVRSLLSNFGTAQGWQPSRGRPMRKAASELEAYPFAPDQRLATFRVGDGHRDGNEASLRENSLIRISGKSVRRIFGDNVPIGTVSLYASPKGEMDTVPAHIGQIPPGVIEVPLLRYDLNRNGVMDDEDYVVAYVSALSDWAFNPQFLNNSGSFQYQFLLNRYDDYRTYWLAAGGGAGAQMERYEQPPPDPYAGVNGTFDAYRYLRSPNVMSWEREVNDNKHYETSSGLTIGGGINWTWRRFTLSSADTTIRLDLPGLDASHSGAVWFYLGWVREGHSSGGIINSSTRSFLSARLAGAEICGNCGSGGSEIAEWGAGPHRDLALRFGNTTLNTRSLLELNAIQLRYRRFISFPENAGLIDVFSADAVDRDIYGSVVRHRPVTYRLSNGTGSLAYVLRVPVDEREIALIDTAREASFTWSDLGGRGTRYAVMLEKDIADYSDSLKEYIRRPVENARYQIRDLRSAFNKTDYLIITHEDFLGASFKLAGHKVNMGFAHPKVVLLRDIYDQFGGGNIDPAAIRNFLLHVYRSWDGGSGFSYVVLVGAGHYDYKGVTTRQPNFMPVPYISQKINDDFYVLLTPGVSPGRQYSGYYLLGRLPVKSEAEAFDIVQKITETEDPRVAVFDAWRGRVLMAYDDDQQGAGRDVIRNHMAASEALSRTIERLRPGIDLRQLPLLEYEWDERYYKPGATRTFINEINNGLALVNWVGHGAPAIIADERLMQKDDIAALNNRMRYPVFTLFSCSIGKFDMPTDDCISAMLLRKPGAGAVTVLASARESGTYNNQYLSGHFIGALFDTTAGANISVGSAITIAKQKAVQREGSFYVTLGDPSINIMKRNRTVGLEITDAAGTALDTLKAMQQVTIRGTVKDWYGQKDAGFSGDSAFVSLTLFNPLQDSVRRKDGGRFFYNVDTISIGEGLIRIDTVYYTLPGSPVFSAKISVDKGEFEQPLLLPMNLAFGKPGVRLTAHAWKAGDTVMGSGHLGGLIFYGSESGQLADTSGPVISVRPVYRDASMNQAGLFVKNRITAQLPLTLEVSIGDENGINLIGDGPDEGLSMEVRGALSKRAINHLFQFTEGSFKQGTAAIQLDENSLKSGTHELIISAQDLLGNVSKLSVALEVVDPAEIKLDHVMNVPNPVRMGRQTRFYYHHSGVSSVKQDVLVTVRIYTLGGRLLSVIRNPQNGQEWVPADQAGNLLTPNVYLYQVTATSPNINRTVKSKIKKLVVHPPR
ncbi:MAG: C25 family cysteine peptidase [Chitinispirillia bacterium]|nr:C25 family cysteine peptidase [Chitinispirillia bacterium]MCL2241081.1 C25 family cysteine peptidase [Chitinispirillia bacterium]